MYPLVESVHVLTLCLFVGMTMMLDLRLTGLALRFFSGRARRPDFDVGSYVDQVGQAEAFQARSAGAVSDGWTI